MGHPKLVTFLIAVGLIWASSAPVLAQSEPAESAPDEPEMAAHGQADGPPTPFGELVAEALSEHPAVERRRAEVRVEEARLGGVGLKPDPSVSLSAEGIPWSDPSLSSSPMSGIQLAISQPLWWPGELDALKEQVEARAKALEPLATEEQVELVVDAAELYYEVYSIDRRLETLEGLKGPVREFIRLLEARIPTGDASVAQVERARLELLAIDDRIFLLRHQRPERVARLNAVLNRPEGSPVNPPAHAEGEQPPEGSLEAMVEQELAPLDELVERGMHNRPAVEAIEHQKGAARAEARAADWQKYPDLRVFGGWRFRAEQDNAMDDGTDFVSLGVQSSLPIWSPDKARSAEDVAQARVISLDAGLENFRLRLRGQIASRLALIDHAIKHAIYYREDLIPQAIQARRAAQAGFQAGRAAYEDWLQAEQRVVEMQTKLVEFESRVRQQRAVILALTGVVPLEAPADGDMKQQQEKQQEQPQGNDDGEQTPSGEEQ